MELNVLYKKIRRMKNDVLMEEPCPLYEPEWAEATEEDWIDFWENEDGTQND